MEIIQNIHLQNNKLNNWYLILTNKLVLKMGMKTKIKDKYISCLLGGTIGDALGAPIEF